MDTWEGVVVFAGERKARQGLWGGWREVKSLFYSNGATVAIISRAKVAEPPRHPQAEGEEREIKVIHGLTEERGCEEPGGG